MAETNTTILGKFRLSGTNDFQQRILNVHRLQEGVTVTCSKKGKCFTNVTIVMSVVGRDLPEQYHQG